MNNNNEKLLKGIADRYVERYGEALRAELGEVPVRETPVLDWRVKRRIQAKRRRRVLMAAGSIAAVLLIAVMLPRLWEDRAQLPLDTQAQPGATPGQPQYETIPLGFTLPTNFSVAHVEQDRGKTIYHLENELRDDVVLVLEKSAHVETAGLAKIPIGAYTAYGEFYADYSVLTFSRGGVTYEMSCRHDLNTLIGLGERILA